MKRKMDLKIKSVIGFSGKIPNSLQYTPCGKYLVYPLGSFVVIKNVKTDKDAFLDGHSFGVTCIAISGDGNRLASGQSNMAAVKVLAFCISSDDVSKQYFQIGRRYRVGLTEGQGTLRFWRCNDRISVSRSQTQAAPHKGPGPLFLDERTIIVHTWRTR